MTATRATLRRLTAILLTVTVLTGIASTLSIYWVHRTAEMVRDYSAPAIAGVAETRGSLTIGHEAAIESFGSGEVQLAGAGVRYQDYVAAASRSLTLVAENNVAGEKGSQKIQLVQGLLVSYLELVGHADAHYRRSGGTELGQAYLWHAWRLLAGEILPALEELRGLEQDVFDRQRSGSALAARAVVGAVPILAMLVLLPVGQIFLRRRFRRMFSIPLVTATGLLLVLAAVVASSTLAVERRLDDTNESLSDAGKAWEVSAPVATGKTALLQLLGCEEPDERCGMTAHKDLDDAGDGTGAGADHRRSVEPDLLSVTERRERLTQDAVRLSNTWVGVPAVALLIAALIWLGFERRLKEYRYPWS